MAERYPGPEGEPPFGPLRLEDATPAERAALECSLTLSWETRAALKPLLRLDRRATHDARTTEPPWMAPQPPFNREDFIETAAFAVDGRLSVVRLDGTVIPADLRVERQVGTEVHVQSLRHVDHGSAWNPLCLPCEDRFRCSPYDDNAARFALLDRLQREDVIRTTVYARARTFLSRSDRRPESVADDAVVVIRTRGDLRNGPGVEWVAPNFVQARTVGIIFGPSGSRKSFFSLDLLFHLAIRRDSFHGLPLSLVDGPVLYVAGEGEDAIDSRIEALEDHYGVDAPDDRFHISNMVNIAERGPAFESLLRQVRDNGYSFIIFDTLRKASGDSEENSASERGAVIDSLYEIQRACSGTVYAVTHTGHDESRIRGSSAQRADVDTVLKIESTDLTTNVSVIKQKDGPEGQTLNLRAVPAGDSFVLESAGPAALIDDSQIIYRSSGVHEVVYGAAASLTVEPGDVLTRTQLVDAAKENGNFGKHKTGTAIADLERAGHLTRVTEHRRGVRAEYRLGPKPWPSTAAEHPGRGF